MNDLRRSGIDTADVSIVGRGYNPGDGCIERVPYEPGWGKTGSFWGGLWEVGSATVFVPDLGFLVVGGPLTHWMQGALESGFAHDGLGPLGVALNGMGVPTENARVYEREVAANRCVLLVPSCGPADVESVRGTGPRRLFFHELEPAGAHR